MRRFYQDSEAGTGSSYWIVVVMFRSLHGISQEELALSADIDRTYISQIERGIGNPSILVLLRISAVFKISLSELFDF